jgi:hypothetical protein
VRPSRNGLTLLDVANPGGGSGTDGRILVRCLSKDGNIRTCLPRYHTVRIGMTHVLSETNENEYPARTKLHDALFWSPNVTR